MQVLKFKSESPAEHQFVMHLRKKVNDYFKQNDISPKANGKMILKTIILFSSYVIPFIILLSISSRPCSLSSRLQQLRHMSYHFWNE